MTVDSPQKAGRREWIGLAVLALPSLLIAIDMTVLHLAVPALSADLAPTSTQLLWISDIYGFLIAGALITMGTLGDRIGRRRLLLIGAVAFAATSVLAAFSTSAEMLIVSRALQGIAGATLMPSTLSLIRNMFHNARQRMKALSVWITSFTVGAAIGPLVGGFLLEYFWWGSVFLINVPVMVLLLVLGPLLLPESRDPDAGRLDLVSAALSLAAILATVYGIKQFAEDGRGTQPAAWVLAGLVLGAVFVRRQRTLPYPLVDLDLFRNPVLSAALSTQALAVAAVAGPFFVISQFMQLVLGLSPLQAGLWALPGTIAGAAGPLLAPVLARLFRPAYVVAGGLVIAAAGAAVLTQVQADSGLAAVVIGHALLSFGIGPALTITVDMLIGAAPPARAGAASAISETSIELGNALGIALLGSVGIAIYRAALSDSVPAGVPLEAADAARDTIGGAVGVAPTLPPTLATQLLGTARAAFTDALQVTAGVSAAVVLALAVLAAALLRRASTEPVPSEPAERPARDAPRLEPQSGTSGSTQ